MSSKVNSNDSRQNKVGSLCMFLIQENEISVLAVFKYTITYPRTYIVITKYKYLCETKIKTAC